MMEIQTRKEESNLPKLPLYKSQSQDYNTVT